MISMIKITLLTGAAALATALVGTGMASAHSAQLPTAQLPSPASFSTASESPDMSHWPGGHCRHGGILGRIEHGEATLRTAHGHEVVDFQRGTVESASPGQLSVRSADGFSASYVVNDSTQIREHERHTDITRVMTNDRVVVVATKSGSTAIATRIIDTGHPTTNR